MRFLRPDRNIKITDKVIEREFWSVTGHPFKVRVRKKSDGRFAITAKLARLIFNKDWNYSERHLPDLMTRGNDADDS